MTRLKQSSYLFAMATFGLVLTDFQGGSCTPDLLLTTMDSKIRNSAPKWTPVVYQNHVTGSPPKYLGGLRATRSLSVEVPGI